MSLFQKSVEKKYLNDLDPALIDKKYADFQNYFGNLERQENIRNSKEEQFQEGFLRELFVNILGYTLKPEPDFNLTTELKNISNSKKADGAILKNDNAHAVIELKSTNTTDLDSIETQAFGYKNHHPKCIYVITSNFEKLRFYIQNAVDHIDFDLFKLTKEQFSLLWLCLAKDKLLNDLPLKIKDSSVLQEENITKKLYADYSKFRTAIYNNLVKNNPDTDKLLLFKKTQKLLDRFLFIFFAEDSLLVPPNSISQIIEKWKDDVDFGDTKPLYHTFKRYFHVLNVGRPKSGNRQEIFAYNGGLFKPDEILDNILIDDDILHEHTLRLSNYDFDTDVDVNILGHIFEHSLGEIENVQAEIKGEKVDNQKTKRKKDGIFYTPKYITKYIVENTLGKLCKEKRIELNIVDEEYAKGRKNRKKDIVRTLDNKLDEYRNWLLTLTILDPACGSGAFLNQALDFLIAEHRKIDELRAQLFGGAIVFSDITTDILEKNIFGVDLNEESVEIAKLSLWLRTAQKGRKLNTLSNNIKCGNSLIDDPEIAGEKAFNWQNEFPDIFARSGFDVVIGNPPYVNINTIPAIHEYLKNTYSEIHTGYNDLMYYFLFKGIDLLNKNGTFGVITSNYFIGNEYAKSLRTFLTPHLLSLINFSNYLIFEDANVHTTIVLADKTILKNTVDYYLLNNTSSKLNYVELHQFKHMTESRDNLGDYWIFSEKDKSEILKKLFAVENNLGTISEIEKGSTSGKNDVFTVSNEQAKQFGLEEELLRINVKNGDILRYSISDRNNVLIYTDNNTEITKFPNVFEYLKKHQEILQNRNEVKKGSYPWWRLERPRRKEIYDSPEKIIVPYRATSNRFAYDSKQRFNDGGDIRVIVISDKSYCTKYVLALLNSKLLNWFYGFIGKPKGKAREYFNEPLAKIPITFTPNETQRKLSDLVEKIINTEETHKSNIIAFLKFICSSLSIQEPGKSLNSWDSFEFNEFVKELNKAIKKSGGEKLSKSDEMDWMEVFENKKSEAQILKSEIEKTDKEIDQMVYKLYGLTEEEIKIVEGAA